MNCTCHETKFVSSTILVSLYVLLSGTEVFSVHSNGIITVAQRESLSFAKMARYQFQVTATDEGTPAQSSVVTVAINIETGNIARGRNIWYLQPISKNLRYVGYRELTEGFIIVLKIGTPSDFDDLVSQLGTTSDLLVIEKYM